MLTGCTTFTDGINNKGIVYGGDYEGNFSLRSLVTQQYVSGLTSGSTGSGGFLGLVTETSDAPEPSELADNQWVKPEPTAGDEYCYTFNSFTDSGSTAISVNLSLEDSYLRYCCTGASAGYWISETYARPLLSGHTWIGDTNCKVCEVPVINEWVSSESQLCYAGQKFAYDTQTIFQIDIGCCVTMPNKIFSENVALCTVGNTCLFTIPSGKTALLSSTKLIMKQTANPDGFIVSMGNNTCGTPSLSYNNMIANCAIDDVLISEVYEIVPVESNAVACDGSCLGTDVYIRVQTATSGTLCANVLVEGYVF